MTGSKGKMQKLREKAWSKYTLYLLCYVALNYIEFLRSTQTGDIWKTAANCTGLVIMVIVFSQLPIRQFLKPVCYIYTAICIVALGAVYLHWTQHIGEYCLGQMLTAVLNLWWLGLVVPYLFRQIFIRKTLRLHIGGLGWAWIAFVIWTVISVAGRWWPIWYLFMFGTFYLIRFSIEDKAALVKAMIDGTIASFFVIQSYAYLFRPYDIVRYQGAFSNCNMMALYYLIVYCMVLFKLHFLHMKKAKWGWKLFYLIGAGGLLAFQFMTICRTAWVCSVLVTVCYGWFAVYRAWKERFRRVLLRGCILVVCAVLTFPAVFLTVRWLPTIHPHPIWHEGEWSLERVASWDPPDSEKFVELDEFLNEAIGRFANMLKIFHSRNPFVMHAYAREGWEVIPEPDNSDWRENSMSIRWQFFKTYWEYSTWFGHPEQDGNYIYEISRTEIWHGQNLWIQMVYSFGYPAGILVAVLMVLAGRKVFRKAGNIRNDSFAIVPVLIYVAYMGFGFAEVVWNPGQLIFTLLFMVMHPQLTNVVEGIETADMQVDTMTIAKS